MKGVARQNLDMQTTNEETKMKVRTTIKAGAINHNETQVRSRAKGLKVKTNVKAGAWSNHNETQVRQAPKGVKVKTSVKAGIIFQGRSGGSR